MDLLEVAKRKVVELNFDPTKDENFRLYCREIKKFLWKVSLRETSDFDVIDAAAARTLDALLEEEIYLGPRSRFSFWRRGRPWRGKTLRFWLFERAKKETREILSERSQSGATPPATPKTKEVLALQREVLLKVKAVTFLILGPCRLKASRLTRHVPREGDCSQSCDLLFLHLENLKVHEVAKATGIPRAVIYDYVRGCWIDRKALSDTPAQPKSIPVVRGHGISSDARRT